MHEAARQALAGWWDGLPTSPLVEGLRTQPDAENVSTHDLRGLMDYLLQRTDVIPGCAHNACIAPEAALAPLRHTLRLMTHVTAQINPVQLLTPDQLFEERSHFEAAIAEGKSYNPKFTYRNTVGALKASLEKTPGLRDEHSWSEILRKLEQFHESISHLEEHMDHKVLQVVVPLLHAKVDDDMAALQLARALDEEKEADIAVALDALYTAPDAEGIDAAHALARTLAEHPSLMPWTRALDDDHHAAELLNQEGATPEQLKDAIERATQMYYDYVSQLWPDPMPSSLRYHVDLDPAYANFDVRDKSSTGPIICIPARPRTWLGVLALCRHEIDMHVRQSINGALLYGLGGGMLKHNQEDLYEGMALYAERQFTSEILGVAQTPCLPYATIIYQDAIEGRTFHEAFEHILSLFPAAIPRVDLLDRAWNMVYRVYRGRLDTCAGEGYGCAKDTGYLRGAIVTHQLHKAGLSHLLDYGIVPLRLLPLHRRLKRDLPLPYPDLNTAKTLLHHYFPHLAHGKPDPR